MKQYCKETATEGELKVPVSFLALGFWPQSTATSCMSMPLTFLASVEGTQAEQRLCRWQQTVSGAGSCQVRWVMQHESFMAFAWSPALVGGFFFFFYHWTTQQVKKNLLQYHVKNRPVIKLQFCISTLLILKFILKPYDEYFWPAWPHEKRPSFSFLLNLL